MHAPIIATPNKAGWTARRQFALTNRTATGNVGAKTQFVYFWLHAVPIRKAESAIALGFADSLTRNNSDHPISIVKVAAISTLPFAQLYRTSSVNRKPIAAIKL